VVYGNFNCDFSPVRAKKRNRMLFKAKGNVLTAKWFVCAPIAHVVVRSCRNFGKHWCNWFSSDGCCLRLFITPSFTGKNSNMNWEEEGRYVAYFKVIF
jgi:hypothetical protein